MRPLTGSLQTQQWREFRGLYLQLPDSSLRGVWGEERNHRCALGLPGPSRQPWGRCHYGLRFYSGKPLSQLLRPPLPFTSLPLSMPGSHPKKKEPPTEPPTRKPLVPPPWAVSTKPPLQGSKMHVLPIKRQWGRPRGAFLSCLWAEWLWAVGLKVQSLQQQQHPGTLKKCNSSHSITDLQNLKLRGQGRGPAACGLTNQLGILMPAHWLRESDLVFSESQFSSLSKGG